MITNSEGISQYVSQKMPVVAQHTEKFYKYNRHIEQHNDRYNIALAHKNTAHYSIAQLHHIEDILISQRTDTS